MFFIGLGLGLKLSSINTKFFISCFNNCLHEINIVICKILRKIYVVTKVMCQVA